MSTEIEFIAVNEGEATLIIGNYDDVDDRYSFQLVATKNDKTTKSIGTISRADLLRTFELKNMKPEEIVGMRFQRLARH